MTERDKASSASVDIRRRAWPARRAAGAGIEPLDRARSLKHARATHWIGGVDGDRRRLDTTSGDGVLKPHEHVIPRTAAMVAEIMVKAEMGDASRNEEFDYFVRPAGMDPPVRRRSDVVKPHLHHCLHVVVRRLSTGPRTLLSPTRHCIRRAPIAAI